MAVKFRFDPLADLDAGERQSLLAMLHRHFHGVDEIAFHEDLASKTHILRLLAGNGTLAGFSTIDYRRRIIAGVPSALLYSGDTIVDPEFWSDANLGHAWVASVLDLHGEAGPLWWLVLTSGVRTYRYLTVCVNTYAPGQPDRFAEDAAKLLPGFARERFGDQFDQATGVVRFSKPQCLREHLAEIPNHIRNDPAVQVFLERNPGYAAGDELVSLCRLEPSNLTAVGRLALRQGRRAMQTAS